MISGSFGGGAKERERGREGGVIPNEKRGEVDPKQKPATTNIINEQFEARSGVIVIIVSMVTLSRQ